MLSDNIGWILWKHVAMVINPVIVTFIHYNQTEYLVNFVFVIVVASISL